DRCEGEPPATDRGQPLSRNLGLLCHSRLFALRKEEHGQLKITAIAFCPQRCRLLLFPPIQSQLQIGRLPQRALASLPEGCGLSEKAIGVGRLLFFLRPILEAFPLTDQALMRDVESSFGDNRLGKGWDDEAAAWRAENFDDRGKLIEAGFGQFCHFSGRGRAADVPVSRRALR